MEDKVTIPALTQMKRQRRKSVGVVAWDYQIARIADRAGVDIVSVGDSVGVNLWGHDNPLEVTMDEMLVVCKAVRRAVRRALVSCDFPFGPLQEGTQSALRAGIRLIKEGGADVVKLDAAAEFPDAVRALTRAGIPVFAQFGLTPQTALRYGVPYSAQALPGAQIPSEMTAKLVEEAKLLEAAGAALLDFTNSGLSREAQWSRPSPSRCSEASAAARGSTGACGSRTPPSAMGRNGSIPKPRPTPTRRSSASKRSPL
jgi:3-methyl-2-oxobutanoate hydroxymethyltransferase